MYLIVGRDIIRNLFFIFDRKYCKLYNLKWTFYDRYYNITTLLFFILFKNYLTFSFAPGF